MPQNVLKHKIGLEHHGIRNLTKIHWNLSTPHHLVLDVKTWA